MDISFRALRADEIECRVQQYIAGKGCVLLLYKDARCDQNILDETVGCMNWQRHHTRENANCVVSIWDSDKLQWIEKEDTGKESNTEAEKGLASDSFKRACFNWGIGRELYTAPFTWVKAEDFKTKTVKGKEVVADTFEVSDIKTENKRILELRIINTRTKQEVFTFGCSSKPKANKKPEEQPQGKKEEYVCRSCGKPFVEFTDKNGEVWSPAKQYEAAKKASADGIARCKACRSRLKEANK